MAAVAPSAPITRDLYTDYFKTPEGQMRTVEGVLALAALISTAEGYCYHDNGGFGFSLFIIVVTFLEAIIIVIVYVLRVDQKLKGINIPLSLLLNDGIKLILYFIISTLSLLSIGRCDYRVAARIVASLFVLAIFLVLVGLLYTDYLSWQKSITSREHNKEIGTTITESSPTVLT